MLLQVAGIKSQRKWTVNKCLQFLFRGLVAGGGGMPHKFHKKQLSSEISDFLKEENCKNKPL